MPLQCKRRNGSFGCRPLRAMRARLLRAGRAVLPPSWNRQWIVRRILATPPWACFIEILP